MREADDLVELRGGTKREDCGSRGRRCTRYQRSQILRCAKSLWQVTWWDGVRRRSAPQLPTIKIGSGAQGQSTCTLNCRWYLLHTGHFQRHFLETLLFLIAIRFLNSFFHQDCFHFLFQLESSLRSNIFLIL